MSAYTDGLTQPGQNCRSTVCGGNDVHAAVRLVELCLDVLEVLDNVQGLADVWPRPLPWRVGRWPRTWLGAFEKRRSDDYPHVWHGVLHRPCVGEWLALWWRQGRREWVRIPCDRA